MDTRTYKKLLYSLIFASLTIPIVASIQNQSGNSYSISYYNSNSVYTNDAPYVKLDGQQDLSDIEVSNPPPELLWQMLEKHHLEDKNWGILPLHKGEEYVYKYAEKKDEERMALFIVMALHEGSKTVKKPSNVKILLTKALKVLNEEFSEENDCSSSLKDLVHKYRKMLIEEIEKISRGGKRMSQFSENSPKKDPSKETSSCLLM